MIPAALGSDGEESYAPSIFVYSLLDVSLVVSFVFLRRICDSRQWQSAYTLLACTFGMWAVLDFIEALMFLDWIPYTSGLIDCLWYLPHVPTILAAGSDLRVAEPVRSESRTCHESSVYDANHGKPK